MMLLLANSASSIAINLRLVYTTVQLSIKNIVVVLQKWLFFWTLLCYLLCVQPARLHFNLAFSYINAFLTALAKNQ